MFTRVGAYLRPGADGGTVEFYNNDEQKQAKDNVYGPACFFVYIHTAHPCAGRNRKRRSNMSELKQERAPIYEALERFRKMRVVPFDVP